ncbi:MAG: hypothetical protein JNK34_05775, partial [Tabrizicola sp.]|nr:hypothetical protein [Tabrizicola sp.]
MIEVVRQNVVVQVAASAPVVQQVVGGARGLPGPGLPPGGATGQVPVKASAADYDFTFADPGGVSDGDKGDITVSGGVWTIDAGAVTDSKIASVAWTKLTGVPAFFDGTWASLTGKPATFPPSSHGHVAADVTDFAATTRSTVLTGYAEAGSRIALAAGDTILGAFGKIGKWLSDFASIAFSGSASDLNTGTLPAARFDDTAHGNRAGGALHSVATPATAGFMSGADKTKLDAILGTNTGDQTITLTGAVTGSGTGSFATTLSNNVVGFGKMVDIATDTLIGRDTAGTGDPAEIGVTGGIEFTGSGAIQTGAFTGDVTKAAGGTALTLATVNSNIGTFGLAGSVAQFVVNAKGLITSVVNVAISITASAISDSTAAGRAMLQA